MNGILIDDFKIDFVRQVPGCFEKAFSEMIVAQEGIRYHKDIIEF